MQKLRFTMRFSKNSQKSVLRAKDSMRTVFERARAVLYGEIKIGYQTGLWKTI